MFTLEKQSWDQRVSALLMDLDALNLALENRVVEGMDLKNVSLNIRQARLLTEMGWFIWKPEYNWRRDAVALMRETDRVYTLADPNSTKVPAVLGDTPSIMAVDILNILSTAEAVMSILVAGITDLEGLNLFRGTEMIRLFQGAREQLIFAIGIPFNYLQGMAVPIDPEWGVNIESGALGDA
jgi:hypothetical protein